jgi:MFS family permease
VPVLASAPNAYGAARLGASMMMTDGWLSGTTYLVWQVVLFVSLGRNLAAYGGAMALAALAGAVVGLVLGRHIDLGHGRRIVVIAYTVTGALAIVRAASLGSPWLAVTANVLGAFLAVLVIPVMGTAVYNLAKAAPCPLRFHIATEGAWDIGWGSAALIAAGLAACGVSLAVAILLALPGAPLGAWLLWRYYGDHPAAGEAVIEPVLAAPPHAPP